MERRFEAEIKKKLKVEFMEEVSWFLGFRYRWEQVDGELTVHISQQAYAKELLHCFGMTDCHAVWIPYQSGLPIDRIERVEMIETERENCKNKCSG